MSLKKSLVILFTIIALSFFLLTSSIQLKDNAPKTTDDVPMANQTDGDISMLDPSTYSIQVIVSMQDDEYRSLQSLNREFMDKYPNITVELKNVSKEQLYTTWKDDAMLGKSTDIMLLDNDWINTYASYGQLSPLSEVVEPVDGVVEAISRQTFWNGYVWAAPVDMDPYVLVWNKYVEPTLIDLNQFSSYEDWETAYRGWQVESKDLDKAELMGMYIPSKDMHALTALAWATGLLEKDQHSDAMQASVQAEAVASFMTWFPSENNAALEAYSEEDIWRKLKEGSLLYTIAKLSSVELYGDTSIGIGPLPVAWSNGGQEVVWLSGRSFTIHAKSKAKDQALSWVKEMTSERSQQQLSAAANTLPVSLSAIRSTARRGYIETAQLREWLSTGKTLPVDPQLPARLEQYKELAASSSSEQMDINTFMRTVYQTDFQTSYP